MKFFVVCCDTGSNIALNKQLLEAHLDGLPEKGYYNMPTRDEKGITFQGQRFMHYTGYCGWLSRKLGSVLHEIEPQFVWISEVTWRRFRGEQRKVALKEMEKALKKEKQEKKKTEEEQPSEEELKKQAEKEKKDRDDLNDTFDPDLPDTPIVIGQVLMFDGPQQAGCFYQVDVLSDKNIHIYVLFEHARRCQRSMVYTTDVRTSFYKPVPAEKKKEEEQKKDPKVVNEAEDDLPHAYGQVLGRNGKDQPYQPSLVISRDAGKYRNKNWGEQDRETFYPEMFFYGLFPEVLIKKYDFWKTGAYSFRGYPKDANGEDQLLILLQAQVAVRHAPTGRVTCVKVEPTELGSSVKERACRRLKISLSQLKHGQLETIRGQPIHDDKTVLEMNCYEWAARVQRHPFSLDPKKQQEHLASDEKPLLLLNMLRAAEESALGRIAKLLRHIEQFSHLLVWSKSDAHLDGEECEISLIELPRLQMSFTCEGYGSDVRLMSQEYDGRFIDTSFDEVFHKWVGDIPHALVLKNMNKENFLLIPNYGLKRVLMKGDTIPTKLILDMTADWATNVQSRFFLYPIHSSGAFLVTTSTSALLYLIIMHLMTMEYTKCGHLLENCSIEGKLSDEETWILKLVEQTLDDQHPDARGLRLRLALMCVLSQNEVPFAFDADYEVYCLNASHVSSPFRIAAKDELKLSPPPERKRWLISVSTEQKEFVIQHRRPPQNDDEVKSFLKNFISEEKYAQDFEEYPDLKEVMEKYMYLEETMTPEDFWQQTFDKFKAQLKAAFKLLYDDRKKEQLEADDDVEEEFSQQTEVTDRMQEALIRVITDFWKRLRSFQEKPIVSVVKKYNSVAGSIHELVRKQKTFSANVSKFTNPKSYQLSRDGAVKLLNELMESDLTEDKFVCMYQMLMGFVRPVIIPKAKTGNENEASDISEHITYRRPPENMTIIRLILRLVAVRNAKASSQNLNASDWCVRHLMVLCQAVINNETTDFPPYPSVMQQNQDESTLSLFDKFKQGVLEASSKFTKQQMWQSRYDNPNSYFDHHNPDNYYECRVSILKMRDEFQPIVITDMSNDSRTATAVYETREGLSITDAELKMFSQAPLLDSTVLGHVEKEDVDLSSRPTELPFEIDKDVCSPCEEDQLEQMRADVEDRACKAGSVYRMKYLRSAEVKKLHEGVEDTSVRDDSAKILAEALDELKELQDYLERQRDSDAEIVQKGRVAIEDFANRGSSQLYSESIRLKFEFMVAALLQKDCNLSQYNSKLSADESALIFNSLTGVLFRSIRLAQTKLCLSTVVRLQKEIIKLIASMIEQKWTEAEGASVDNLPYPTVMMVHHCLEKCNYRKGQAEVLLKKLLETQKQIADDIESQQRLSAQNAIEAATLMFHIAFFDKEKVDLTQDAEKLISLGRRGCCLNGRSLCFPTLTENDSSARGMSMTAMTHVVHHTSQALADMLSSERAYYKYGKSFDPRFLVFEYVVNFMLRERQVELVNTFVDKARDGKSLVNQMIMGAGKTTVIAPLLSLILANGDPLVMLIIPKALLDMGLSVMRNVFSNIISKKVYTFEFSRSMVDANQNPLDLPALLATLKKAQKAQSIVCTTPESVKALMLKYIDLMEETRVASPSLCLPRKNFGTHYLWEVVEKQAKGYKDKCEQMDILADILCLWRDKGVALLDEVDTLLHPLRSELNFPVGDKSTLDLVESGDRFIFPLFLYDAFFYARIGRTSVYKPSTEEAKILVELQQAIKDGIEALAFQTFPHIILLRKAYYRKTMIHPLARWAMIWLRTQDDISSDLRRIKKESVEQLGMAEKMMLAYMTTLKQCEATTFIQAAFSKASVKRLNLARDWLVSFIPHTISKINCVDYGLVQENHLQVWLEEGEPKETQSKSRLHMAVPFVGKDVPSRHSEFAHPEVLIGLTILSYRYEGLRHDDMKKVVTRLKESMQQEPGAFFQRPSQIKFKDWIDLYEALERSAQRKPVKILPLHLFPPDIGNQMQVLITAFAKLPEVVEFWLTGIAFPGTLRYQVRKLQASGVDLGSSILFKTRLGFSGTPSNLLPIDMGKCGFEPGCQSSIIEVCQSSKFTTFKKFAQKWNVESLLEYVAKHTKPPFHALIDTGALVTGMSNKEVAEFLLKVGLKGMECCVYLDDADRKMVINRAGLVIPFARSGVAPERRFSFFDQVHTTGMDIKQGIDACAAVTLGKDMTFRDHSQGIYRMRGLGKGQTVHLLVVPEVLELMHQAVPADKAQNDEVYLLENVVTWLITNSLKSSNQQYMALCQQNLTNLYRKEAFRNLSASRNPPIDKNFVFQNRFVYQPKEMSEEEAQAVLESSPLMDRDAFERLKQRYDIEATLSIELAGGQDTDVRTGEYTVPILNEKQEISKFVTDLMEMAGKDIVSADDLVNTLNQKRIPPHIFSHRNEEVEYEGVNVLLKDNKYVRHPASPGVDLPPVKTDEEEKKDATETDEPPKEVVLRDCPHVTVRITCEADMYQKFKKHYQPKSTAEKAEAASGEKGKPVRLLKISALSSAESLELY